MAKQNNFKWVVTWSIGYNNSYHVFNTADAAVNFAETITDTFDGKIYKWYTDPVKVQIETMTQEEINHRHEEWKEANKQKEEEETNEQ